jgi:glutathione S-transferase
MILYGRYFSPFVRRVGAWMILQERAFEHVSLPPRGAGSEALAKINPMLRIPALRLDDGTVLIETSAIIDWLEDSAPSHRRLLPGTGEDRRRQLQDVALANALAEKAVALGAESLRRPKELHWADEIARIQQQIAKALEIMEAKAPETGFNGPGGGPDGATVAVVTAYDFAARLFPDQVDNRYPRLTALSARANALPAFASTRP